MGTEWAQFPLGGEQGRRERNRGLGTLVAIPTRQGKPLKQRGFLALVGAERTFRAVRLAERTRFEQPVLRPIGIPRERQST
jgi:hypothetical protein